MTYKVYFHAVRSEKGLFKREDNRHLIHQPAEFFDSALTPGPYLGADIVKYGNAQSLGPGGYLEVELGIIYKDKEVRPVFAQPVCGTAECLQYGSEMIEDFDQPHYCELRAWKQQIKPCLFHFRATYADKFCLRQFCLQGTDEV